MVSILTGWVGGFYFSDSDHTGNRILLSYDIMRENKLVRVGERAVKY